MTEPTSLTAQLQQQRATKIAEATATYWAAVEAVLDDGELSAELLDATNTALDVLGRKANDISKDARRIAHVRDLRENGSASLRPLIEAHRRAQEDALEAEAVEHRLADALAKAKEAAGMARIVVGDLGQRLTGVRQEQQRELSQANETEMQLRMRGYVGDLGKQPAPRQRVRVRTRTQVYIDGILREAGEIFECYDDQIGGPVERLTKANANLGVVYRLRARRQHKDSRGVPRAVGDVYLSTHPPAGDLAELVGDEVALGDAEMKPPPEPSPIDGQHHVRLSPELPRMADGAEVQQ